MRLFQLRNLLILTLRTPGFDQHRDDFETRRHADTNRADNKTKS